MRKSTLRRSIALSTLITVALTGSVWAAEIGDTSVVRPSTSAETGNLIAVAPQLYPDAVTFGGDTLTITADNQTASGSTYAFYDYHSTYSNTIGVKDTTSKVEFGASGLGEVRTVNLDAGYQDGGNLTIAADTVVIKAHSENSMARAVNVKSGSDIVIDANKTIIEATSNAGEGYTIGVGAFSGSSVEIKGDVEIKADYAVTQSGGSTIKINEDGKGTVKIDGLVSFHRTGSTAVNADVLINLTGEDSYLNGNIIAEDTRFQDPASTVSGMKLNLSDGATWTTDDKSFVNELTMDGGVINTTAGVQDAVRINQFIGEGTIIVADDTAGQIAVGTKADDAVLTVAQEVTNMDSMSDDAAATQLKELQGIAVMANGEEAADKVALTGDSAIYDQISADVTDNGIGAVNKDIAQANVSVRDMAGLGLIAWRAETNDMNKRLGELRNAKGEHGIWFRTVGGEDEYKSVEYDYQQYQIGYDKKVDDEWTVGAAFTYTDGESTFAQGCGENENKGIAIYGSKLNDDGSFLDLIAKYSHMENDFVTNGGMGDADYSTNGYSLSAEYGKRIQQGNGFWLEPQVELTYGRVEDAKYTTKKGIRVAQDSMESIVARVGCSLGKDIKRGNVYVRGSYLYDFDGETSVNLAGMETLKQDLGGGWWEVGIGANINLSDVTYLYADIEKTFGGEVDTTFQWNLGVRYSF